MVYEVIVLDWSTNKVVGGDLSLRSRSEEWSWALEMGLRRKFSEGLRSQGLKLISNNGSHNIGPFYAGHGYLVD
jgi:hypothetical protein